MRAVNIAAFSGFRPASGGKRDTLPRQKNRVHVSALDNVHRHAIKVYTEATGHKQTLAEIFEPGPFDSEILVTVYGCRLPVNSYRFMKAGGMNNSIAKVRPQN